jgi:hypothetical protein
MKQLDRLLMLQGQRCFFCDEFIPMGEASVEHLIATANGGTKDDGNCVVCCKTLNTAFGHRSVKEKLLAVLNHRGPFVCPRKTTGLPVEAVPVDPQVDVVVANLQRRGSARPRKEKSLRNTIAATFQPKLGDKEVSSLMARLQAKRIVSISNDKVAYNLPAKRA